MKEQKVSISQRFISWFRMVKVDKEYYREWKEKKKAKKILTEEERRRKALSIGTDVWYLKCPLCNMSKPLETWKGKTVFKFYDDDVLQLRRGGGRGIGFFKVEGLDLKRLKEEYQDIFINLKEEVEKLRNAIIEAEKS